MNPQPAHPAKAAADRETTLLRHLALCRELREGADALVATEPENARRLRRAWARANLLTLHFADSFCDAFDNDIAPLLGLAPPAE
jgi:hypothetical protein